MVHVGAGGGGGEGGEDIHTGERAGQDQGCGCEQAEQSWYELPGN